MRIFLTSNVSFSEHPDRVTIALTHPESGRSDGFILNIARLSKGRGNRSFGSNGGIMGGSLKKSGVGGRTNIGAEKSSSGSTALSITDDIISRLSLCNQVTFTVASTGKFEAVYVMVDKLQRLVKPEIVPKDVQARISIETEPPVANAAVRIPI
jgi:hypothetical protein